jgi:peptide/nickel transport system permease protein
MRRFLIRRASFALLTLVAATFIVFALSYAAGDPRLLYAKPGGYGMSQETYEAIGRKLHLDKPLPARYVLWVGGVLRGDFGKTIVNEKPVIGLIKEKTGATVQLAIGAWLFATLVGVPLGVISAIRRGGSADYLARGIALLGQSMPGFWIGIMGIYFFGVILGWLPTFGRGDTDLPVWHNWKHYVLPVATLGFGAAAGYLRLTRSSMLEVLDSEYVKLARAKGARGWVVIWKHAFKNALIGPLTYSGLLLAGFLGGAVVIETVFSWPGLGTLATQAVWDNDFPVLTGSVLVFAVLFVGSSFILDLLYGLVDPRIRYG